MLKFYTVVCKYVLTLVGGFLIAKGWYTDSAMSIIAGVLTATATTLFWADEVVREKVAIAQKSVLEETLQAMYVHTTEDCDEYTDDFIVPDYKDVETENSTPSNVINFDSSDTKSK